MTRIRSLALTLTLLTLAAQVWAAPPARVTVRDSTAAGVCTAFPCGTRVYDIWNNAQSQAEQQYTDDRAKYQDEEAAATVTGVKTFTANPVFNGSAIVNSYLAPLPTLGTSPSPARQTAIVDSEITSITTRAKLPTNLMYDDEANTWAVPPALYSNTAAGLEAAFPAASGPDGRLARVTDGVRGIWRDFGAFWGSLTNVADARDFGFATSATSAANKTALQAAVDALGGAGKVTIPCGSYSVDPPITPTTNNVTIEGCSESMAYEASTAATRLIFTSGTNGFDLTGLGTSGNHITLKNLSINGNGVLANGIKIKGQKQIEYVNVLGTTNAGYWLADDVNQTKLFHVSAVGNAGYGFLVGGSGATSNTVMSIDHFTSRSNLIGFRLENAAGARFSNGVVESNTQEGLQVYRAASGQITNIEWDNVHFENNWVGTSGYNITINALATDYVNVAGNMMFLSTRVDASGTTKVVNIQAGRHITFINPNFGGPGATQADAINFGTYAAYVGLWNYDGVAITDIGNKNWQGWDGYQGDELGGPTWSNANVRGQLKFQVATGTAPFIVASTTPVANLTVQRGNNLLSNRYFASGTALVAGDIALSAGWGTTATVSAISGSDQRFELTITSSGTGQGASPTLTITWKDGSWTTAPFLVCSRTGGNQVTIVPRITSRTATTAQLTWDFTPVAAETYGLICIVMG